MVFQITEGETSPGLGGFTFATATRANAVFVTRMILKIPVGVYIDFLLMLTVMVVIERGLHQPLERENLKNTYVW